MHLATAVLTCAVADERRYPPSHARSAAWACPWPAHSGNEPPAGTRPLARRGLHPGATCRHGIGASGWWRSTVNDVPMPDMVELPGSRMPAISDRAASARTGCSSPHRVQSPLSGGSRVHPENGTAPRTGRGLRSSRPRAWPRARVRTAGPYCGPNKNAPTRLTGGAARPLCQATGKGSRRLRPNAQAG